MPDRPGSIGCLSHANFSARMEGIARNDTSYILLAAIRVCGCIK